MSAKYADYPTHRSPIGAKEWRSSLPQTHTNLLTHIIFGTKSHKRWFDNSVRADMHAYLGAIVRQ